MIEVSSMVFNLPKQELDNIQFIPIFPVSDNENQTSTLMGEWQYSIPVYTIIRANAFF
jgi:hypothetical protein